MAAATASAAGLLVDWLGLSEGAIAAEAWIAASVLGNGRGGDGGGGGRSASLSEDRHSCTWTSAVASRICLLQTGHATNEDARFAGPSVDSPPAADDGEDDGTERFLPHIAASDACCGMAQGCAKRRSSGARLGARRA